MGRGSTVSHDTSPSVQEHRAAAPDSIRCAILTLSDTRTPETDKSGAFIRESLKADGNEVIDYRILPDEPARIRELVLEWSKDAGVDAILTNGGTGIARRDSTYDALTLLLEKRIDGFGEIFRMLSFQEIGAAAMLSRAVAGSVGSTIVIAMPGSSNAVRLAMEQLVLPELRHLVYELRK
jgi:molybdenum cofactor biosynthesis protein B